MPLNQSSAARAHLRRLLALGVIAVLLLLTGAAGVMGYWTWAVDRETARREEALVARTLERRKARILEDVASAAIWDDAWKATAGALDTAWADTNFGQYYAEYMGHDRTLLFDGEGRPVYASSGGEMKPVADLAAFGDALAPLVAEVRATDRALRATKGGPAVGFDGAVARTRAVRADGGLWLVAAVTVTPEAEGMKSASDPAPVVVSARRVDASFLAELEKDLGIAGARLVDAGGEARASAPVLDTNGRALADIAWTPARPGGALLLQIGPFFLVALALVLAAAGALALGIRRTLRALAVNDLDLTRAMADLTAARDRAEAASVAKSQFLANVSHEIRTPLNGVLGMAQIMARGQLAPDQRERLEIISQSGAALLGLLNDVLDLAKIEAGKLEIVRIDTPLKAALAAICEPHAAAAAEKGLAFGLLVEEEADAAWRLDALRLGQVVGNLLSNAVKFTAAGHVSVRAWVGERGLEFAVMDTGPGIPDDRMDELFGKFNQLDASTTRQYGGTGLGLAICRELVELMDGALEVDSRVGHGCLFSFHLPADRVAAAALAA